MRRTLLCRWKRDEEGDLNVSDECRVEMHHEEEDYAQLVCAELEAVNVDGSAWASGVERAVELTREREREEGRRQMIEWSVSQ